MQGFPAGSDGKESAWNVEELGLIPESGRSPGEGHGNPLQYSCLENLMDRGVSYISSTMTEKNKILWPPSVLRIQIHTPDSGL